MQPKDAVPEVAIALSSGKRHDRALSERAKAIRQEHESVLIVQHKIFCAASHGLTGYVIPDKSTKKILAEAADICADNHWSKVMIVCYQPRRRRAEEIARTLGLEVIQW